MADAPEIKSEKIGFSVTKTARDALEFLEKMHPDRYDGAASVLWDYSVNQAVAAHAAAMNELAGAPAA